MYNERKLFDEETERRNKRLTKNSVRECLMFTARVMLFGMTFLGTYLGRTIHVTDGKEMRSIVNENAKYLEK
jgi:hypothetical protein